MTKLCSTTTLHQIILWEHIEKSFKWSIGIKTINNLQSFLQRIWKTCKKQHFGVMIEDLFMTEYRLHFKKTVIKPFVQMAVCFSYHQDITEIDSHFLITFKLGSLTEYLCNTLKRILHLVVKCMHQTIIKIIMTIIQFKITFHK